MRRFIFGSDDFAHPWLRWFSVPLLRIGLLLVGVPPIVTGHATWVSTVGAACLVISIVAGGYDFVERRRRHTASQR